MFKNVSMNCIKVGISSLTLMWSQNLSSRKSCGERSFISAISAICFNKSRSVRLQGDNSCGCYFIIQYYDILSNRSRSERRLITVPTQPRYLYLSTIYDTRRRKLDIQTQFDHSLLWKTWRN